MRFGIETSPVGVMLIKHLQGKCPKSVILLAKSGAGKTTAIFDAARVNWCILFTASSTQEDIGIKRDPGGTDYSFANLVDLVASVLSDKKLTSTEMNMSCNHYMKAFVISRLVILYHFRSLTGATPEAWLVYQLTGLAHHSTNSIFSLLQNRPVKTLLLLQNNLQPSLGSLFFAFDEAQYGYELLRDLQNIWHSNKNRTECRGIACPFIRTLASFIVPVVLAGTALSLKSAESCTSDLGKAERSVVFTDFPSLCLAEIEEKLAALVDLDDVDLCATNLWKLEGRGRLFGGLILTLAGCISTDNKTSSLNGAIDQHYDSVLKGLINRIKDAFPPQCDPLSKKLTLPRSLEVLGIAALWGGAVALPSGSFDKDLLHVGLCNVEKSSLVGDAYVLSEELGKEAILAVAQDASVVGDSFARVLQLCATAAGHAMEPLIVAELAMWSQSNKGATVYDFIYMLFDDLPADLPIWVKTAPFNVMKGCNKQNRIAANCSNDIQFISKGAKEKRFRDTLLSPTTVKRPDFEAVMGQGVSPWFLAVSSKLYGNTFDDSNGNDLRSTQPSMFYCKKDGTDNSNCSRLKQEWKTFRAEQTDLFKQCLRIHFCIPDVKRNNEEPARLIWVDIDGSIVLYITSKNIRRLFRADSIEMLQKNCYLTHS
eukprot:scaffold343392_cov47-Attheya_sp.AAC.2